jgi:hypothetical protein
MHSLRMGRFSNSPCTGFFSLRGASKRRFPSRSMSAG